METLNMCVEQTMFQKINPVINNILTEKLVLAIDDLYSCLGQSSGLHIEVWYLNNKEEHSY